MGTLGMDQWQKKLGPGIVIKWSNQMLMLISDISSSFFLSRLLHHSPFLLPFNLTKLWIHEIKDEQVLFDWTKSVPFDCPGNGDLSQKMAQTVYLTVLLSQSWFPSWILHLLPRTVASDYGLQSAPQTLLWWTTIFAFFLFKTLTDAKQDCSSFVKKKSKFCTLSRAERRNMASIVSRWQHRRRALHTRGKKIQDFTLQTKRNRPVAQTEGYKTS